MESYELVMIVNPEARDEAVEAVTSRLSRFLTERGGELVSVKPLGRKRLVYPVKRLTEGIVVEAHLNLERGAARELESSLLLYEEILRSLLTRTERAKSPR